MKANEVTEILEAVHSRCSVEDYIHLLNGLIEKAAREGKNSVKLYEVKYSSKDKDIPEPSPLVADAILQYFEDEGFHVDRDVSCPGISWKWHDEAKLMRSQRLSLAAVNDKVEEVVFPICKRISKVERLQYVFLFGIVTFEILLVLPYFHFYWDAFTGQSSSTKSSTPSEYLFRNFEEPIPTKIPKKIKKEAN